MYSYDGNVTLEFKSLSTDTVIPLERYSSNSKYILLIEFVSNVVVVFYSVSHGITCAH